MCNETYTTRQGDVIRVDEYRRSQVLLLAMGPEAAKGSLVIRPPPYCAQENLCHENQEKQQAREEILPEAV